MPLDVLTRRAALAPATLDREARTVEVVLSTGAAVPRAGFTERLAIAPENVEVSARVPLLDAHRQGSIRDILGRVEDVRHEDGRIVATLRVTSDHALDMIERGDVGGVSIGYRVAAWAEGRDPSTGARVRTATRWTLLEASLVPVPADPGATVRTSPMEEEIETQTAETEDRAAVNQQIRSIATVSGLDAAFTDAQIDRGATVEQARAAAFEALVQRGGGAIRTQRAEMGASGDDPAVMVTRMAEALAANATGDAPSDAARPYVHMGFADCARALLAARGERVSTLSREEVLVRAAAHTTSDFPNLTTGIGNRILMPAYQAAQSPLRQLARQRTLPDFRAATLLRLGEFGKLKPVNELGEIKALTVGEGKEGYSLSTFGGLFNLSRKALINDDLGAFARWAELMGRSAAETEADQLVQLLIQSSGAGPLMGDGVRLFHASHGNLAATGGALSVATLSAARLSMRVQKGLDGATPINVVPKFLVVSPTLETTAEQILATLAAATVEGQNVFSGKLTLLVEGRLPANSWYVFADPAVSPVIEYAYLSSAQGPQLATRDGWEVLAREFRVVLDFGCGAIDWRGAYRNPGA